MLCATCPVVGSDACLGETIPTLCHLPSWRDRLAEISRLGNPLDFAGNPAYTETRLSAEPGPPSPSVFAAVNDCPDRGGVLPLSGQVDGDNGPNGCQCGGAELSECRAGKGTIPDFPNSVTLAMCIDCRTAFLAAGG